MINRNRPHLLLTFVLAMFMIGTALTIVPIPVLGEDKPDLTLEMTDIHFSDNEPEEGDEITIIATISNQGEGDASDILVTFKDSIHSEGNVTTIGNCTIRLLKGGEQTNVSVVWQADPAGNHTIKVSIDPKDEIDEENESNNNAERRIVVKKGSSGDTTILKGYTREATRGNHIPYVDILVVKGNYSETTRSDDEGSYKIELEEGGEYEVYAEKDGYKDYEANITVQEGNENTHHIEMEKEQGGDRTWIYGHVYEDDHRGGTPIENAEVTITGKSCNCSYTVHTDRDGYYEKELSQGDNYTVTAEKDGYKSKTEHVYIDEGESREVDFHLDKESGGGDTILKGYTKEEYNGSHISYVYIQISKGNYNTTTESDGNGYYKFDLEEGGTYHIRAEKDGYKDYETNVSVQERNETTHHIIMEEEENNHTYILGYIFEDEGRGGTPINDARVTITNLDCHCPYRTYSNEDGYYEYELSEAANYSIEVEKQGFETQTKTTYIREGEHKRIDFYLERDTGGENKTILNGYTMEYDRGTHISFVDITISRGNYTNSTTSDQDGYYKFELPEGGTYRIEAEKEGYKDYLINVSVEEGEEKLHHIYMEGESSGETILKGYTMKATRGNHVPYVDIWIYKGNFSETTQSLDNGSYRFTLEEGGTYHIQAQKEGYKDYKANVTVEEGYETTHNIHMEPVEQGSPWISGHIKNKESYVPLPQAVVTVTGKECNCSYTFTTNENGYYEIKLDIPGNYTVRVQKNGYESQTRDAHAKEAAETTVNFQLERIVTRVSGHVWQGQTRGNGINDVKIRIESNNEEYTVYTDRNGFYEQELDEGGNFTLAAFKEGYLRQTVTITIVTGDGETVDFFLYPDTTQTGEDKLFLRENDGLSPNILVKSPAEIKTVEAEYDQYPGTRANRQWVDVGTWTTEPMIKQHILLDSVIFNGWFKVRESDYNANPDWEFVLYHNGVEIASAEKTGSDESQENVVEFEASTDLNEAITLETGDTLSVSIHYCGWEDIHFYYGNVTYDSGVMVNAYPGFTGKPAKERYGVEIEASRRTVDLEGKNQTIISITIENTGLEEDTYSLTLTGSYQGWKAIFDSQDTITLMPGATQTMSLTLSEDVTESPDGDTIVVEVVVRSETYPDVYDSVRIEGKLEDSGTEIPDLTIPLIAVSLGAGALVASFRRRF